MKNIKFLAIIPARKNSKRIKNKNLKKINKTTLFDYTFNAAKKCKEIDKIIITTDIPKFIKRNTNRIIYIKRPKYLCKDNSSTESAVNHALNYLDSLEKVNVQNIVLLQPTSPFRTSEDISSAIKKFKKENLDSLFSAFKRKMFIWGERGKSLYPINYSLKKRLRTQNSKRVIVENGAIFIFSKKGFEKYNNRLFKKKGVYFMTSRNSIDIDDQHDLKVARFFYNK
ncbi:acylneuraminate cytidylyltransferase family protein [Candidatus Pelagibacter sp. HIMB123]|uniref:acylneuraminate cytidylyltransferase family protein n=1 Tax=Candidatus Pelagibacter sp. HIMB123 TaxID=3415413 RepID=UPI003F82C8B0